MTFEKVVEEILETETPFKRKGTRAMHSIYLEEIKFDLGKHDLDNFTRVDFHKWIKEKRIDKPKRSTFNDYTKFINLIFNYAYQNKYITQKLKFPMVDGERKKAGRVYSDDELKRIWVNMTDESLKLQFILSFECFMRLREGLYLRWECIDFVHRCIRLEQTDVKTGSKTKKGRIIPLSPAAFNLLKNQFARGLSPTYVFPSPIDETKPQHDNKTAWNLVKRKARIKGRARWHDLRHTALSKAVLEKRVPLATLTEVAGLSLRTLERVYLHADIEHLRDIANTLSISEIAHPKEVHISQVVSIKHSEKIA